jgi:hypothetical protein
VILTFNPQTSSSWDLFLSAWGMCVLKHIQIKETELQIKSSRKQASRF